MLIMLVSEPNTMRIAQAAGPDCQTVLDSCDLALKAKQRELDLSDLGVKLRDDNTVQLQKENAQLRDRGQAWYENIFLWAAIGVFVGARVTR